MKRITALILFSILLVSCTENPKKVKLAFKYTPGMKLEYTQISKRQTEATYEDSILKKDSDESKAIVLQEIIEVVNDSTYIIDEVDTWFSQRPNKDDSTLTDSISYSRALQLTTLRNGKIIDFKAKDADTHISTYMKNYYEQGLPVFPSNEVEVGYSWTQTTSVVLPSETMNASTTYSIKSFVRELGYDCAIIEYTGNLLIPIEPKEDDKTQRSGIDRIHTKGMIYFAYIDGFVVKQTEDWQTDGDRIQMKDGKWERYSFVSKYDVNFTLTKIEGLK